MKGAAPNIGGIVNAIVLVLVVLHVDGARHSVVEAELLLRIGSHDALLGRGTKRGCHHPAVLRPCGSAFAGPAPPDLDRDPAKPTGVVQCSPTGPSAASREAGALDRPGRRSYAVSPLAYQRSSTGLYVVMETVPNVLSVLLGLVFLAAGLSKIAGPVAGQRRADIARFGLPSSVTPVIGLIEVAAADLLIAAVVTDEPDLARLGAALLVVTMLGALVAHLRVRDSLALIAAPAILGVLAVATLVAAG